MPPPKSRRRWRRWLIILVLLTLAGTFTYRTLRPKKEIVSVQVGKVVRRNVTETVTASGRLLPVTQVMMSPEVAGEIIELAVKEGDSVKKDDLLVQIRPDTYRAATNSATASYQSSLAAQKQASAELRKAEADFKRNAELLKAKLLSLDKYAEFETAFAVAQLRVESAAQQAEQARFALDKANEDLAKTTIRAPIEGTVTNLKSQLGERVLGTSFNMGTEMMTIAKLDQMEARVDIGEIDIVLIQPGQKVNLEVDAFKDRKFHGTVSAIANAVRTSSTLGAAASSAAQNDAPKFEVKIRLIEKESFRPGMSVTAEIETRAREAVLAVPIQSVTTRLPAGGAPLAESKTSGPVKPQEVVFALEGDHVQKRPVKTGISDSEFFEISEGLTEGESIVTGGYKAIAKDLEDGRQVQTSAAASTGAAQP